MYLPTTHQHMTAEEFAELPEGPPYFQLVEGELFFMATPTLTHQRIVLNLAFSIKLHLRAHPEQGEVVISPSEVYLDEKNVFEPDIYFVGPERAEILKEDTVRGVPDLVVEVLSPSTARLDWTKKRGIYLQKGVREIWFVSPEFQSVEVHFPDTDPLAGRRLEVGGTLTSALLPGWSVELAELFA